VQKGDEPGEFSIQGEDGKVWGLKSSSVRLEEHLGHTVTVTGSASKESRHRQASVQSAAFEASIRLGPRIGVPRIQRKASNLSPYRVASAEELTRVLAFF